MFVACATDRNYLEMTGVLIRSIACQPHATPLEVIVFGIDLLPRHKAQLLACTDASTKVSFIDAGSMDMDVLRGLGSARHLSMATYARLLIPDLLGERRGRLIYLDCDIVVNASLDPLFAWDMGDLPVAAVPNAADTTRIGVLNSYIDRAADEPYFNAGVLLIDLDRWQQQGLGPKCLDCARSRDGFRDADQAILNKVLTGLWAPVDRRWNANPKRFSPADARSMPLQHFWSGKKPFFADYPLALRERYDFYRAMTPWASARRSTRMQRSIKKRIRSVKGFFAGLKARPA